MNSLIIYISFIYLLLFVINSIQAHSYENNRCKCICPSTFAVNNKTDANKDNQLFIANVAPNQCNCDQVILPKVSEDIKGKEEEFCLRCDCKYENRNTTTIKIVVYIVIIVTSLLVIYMIISLSLDYITVYKLRDNYQQHRNEEDEITVFGDQMFVTGNESAFNSQIKSNNNVLNIVGQQQDKWRKQVKEQRKNIYDKHTMLN